MSQDFAKLFAMLEPAEPSADLAEKILRRIDEEKQKRRATWHAAVLAVVSVTSASVSVVAWQAAGAEFVSSGFTEFASLLLSDASILAANWSSFLYAAAESFPVASVAALFASGGLFLSSSRHLFRDARFVINRRMAV